jgi:glycerol-3-phosphate dehydrogenase
MARTVEDVLARRTRLLFLRAREAVEVSPMVATLLAKELHHNDAWIDQQLVEFRRLAKSYLPPESTL